MFTVNQFELGPDSHSSPRKAKACMIACEMHTRQGSQFGPGTFVYEAHK